MGTLAGVARRRMRNEHLAGAPLARPEDVVRWLGAVQAQDYAGAKWAIGQRARACSDADVERAFEAGRFIRTHVLRPTWHFVMPADLRWMLKLTAPRISAAMAYYHAKLELDGATFARSTAILAKATRDGRPKTRDELARALESAGIRARGERLGHLLMRAELLAVLCSGPRVGKQFTYALLDERVPPAPALSRDESLAELTRRYFTSHGPALPQDFAWWSGLTVADARAGLAMIGKRLAHEVVEGKTYWFAPTRLALAPRAKTPTVHLLPNYDEYLIAYRDHGASLDARRIGASAARDQAFMSHLVVLDGHVIGGWRRILAKEMVVVETKLLTRLDAAERDALQAAAERYGRFMGRPVRLSSSEKRAR